MRRISLSLLLLAACRASSAGDDFSCTAHVLSGSRARQASSIVLGRCSPTIRASEKEFQAWAKAHEPDEYAYLRPNGRIDPTGDRAPRTRALLLRWRKAAGLPDLAGDGS